MLINPNAVNIKFFILEDRHQSYNTSIYIITILIYIIDYSESIKSIHSYTIIL
jgi:hypothetical protein